MQNQDVASDYYKKYDKWYQREVFPLLPIIRRKPAEKYNSSAFSFHWLFIYIWTLDSVEFEFTLNFGSHFGFGISMLLPYLRVVLCIPMPEAWSTWIQRNLWRKGLK